MYFWRLEKLKTEMAARPLSEREALPYLVVFVALSSAVAYIPQTSHNLWDGFGAVWSVLLAAVGTVYIYRQNGGAAGQHFLQRYFAVGWVVFIRWLAVLILVAVPFYGTWRQWGPIQRARIGMILCSLVSSRQSFIGVLDIMYETLHRERRRPNIPLETDLRPRSQSPLTLAAQPLR